MSDRENITDQENIDEFQIEEVSTYPINNNILYRERVNKVTKRSFNYVIIKEGVYPNGTQTGPKSLQDSKQLGDVHPKRRLFVVKLIILMKYHNFVLNMAPTFNMLFF
ncbi:hypothetical protein GLOIN_2v1766442 [Rhizophagus irregularis DAOM 181602=DAOM 197198]|uniref:Uncharacterized protein n=1 Tax=Rhizophagus irregularis (strain DAOM 181602 / DAOM 197198 / MUCL 43194) TaxID=747089 RepID=A0A2P4QLP6_RHIID|nr:hypothetical protein GLOIN_2v1766442 [Rhizophagus irregularis DAOM 181602=DAOM 197198]POG78554.1 hypothetical protein GLOIN_2v1766442 [Rhizophagus irregularis DAOM 181602=DAOM 197198]|eukprot:XP_025185420.1 hypothetical protein GLOIN_2v1766442 [Rhizophagus irregularis DAOM 181602=DAOM 197198]